MSQRPKDHLHGDLVATLAVTGRADLTDEQWAVLEPLLPRGKKPGRPPERRKRQLIDGIRWRTRAGGPWRDVPPAYGPWQTVYGLFRRWQRNGTWRKILTALQGRADAAGLITWDVSVDSTVARAHQHAAGARKRGDLQAEPPGGMTAEPADHGLGRSRGGLTTKVHLACEQRQKPLSVVITAGQRGDSPQFQPVLEAIAVPRLGPGAPGPARIASWPTRPTAPAPTAPTCADAGSGARSRRRPTRSAIARPRAAEVAVRPPSIPKITRPAMPWNAASTGSSATAPWPPATTSSPSATKPPSTSPRSTNGSYPLIKHALGARGGSRKGLSPYPSTPPRRTIPSPPPPGPPERRSASAHCDRQCR